MTPNNEPDTDEILPRWDQPPLALPVEAAVPGEAIPMALPVEPCPPVVPTSIACRICGSDNPLSSSECHDCGYHFTEAELARARTPEAPAVGEFPLAVPVTAEPVRPIVVLQNRFEVGEKVSERQGVIRYRGLDRGDGSHPPVPVFILQEKLAEGLLAAEPLPASPDEAGGPGDESEEILPHFDELTTSGPVTEILPARPAWPSLTWERGLLGLEHPGLPHRVAEFIENGCEYLVEEIPTGMSLWDAWDDPEQTSAQKFGYLVQVAETLHALHQYHALVEGLRPDIVVVTPEGKARITDLTDLLPLPLVEGAPIRGTPYTAPELVTEPERADARADLFSFGAMLYALHVGRQLDEKVDFERPGLPKPFIPRFPDIHPGFGRLMSKTFRKEPDSRFPSDEAGREDATGFLELIRTLESLRRSIDHVRLEIASWTTTGMVRSGNEDALALLHACETRQDDVGEAALVILCDGMGGYEAGEVAAAMAICIIRQYLVQQKMFAHLTGTSLFPGDPKQSTHRAETHAGAPLDVEACKQLLRSALREANRQIYHTSRSPGSRRRGMGCTAEVVYIDGRNVVVGHVGDSRTYHLH